MNLHAKPPEKKKRKKSAKSLTSTRPTTPSFSLLPDEITENYLARVPRSYYPKLSLVSKSFRSILSSTDIYATRSRFGSTQQCFYICICCWNSSHRPIFKWITLSINPSSNRTKNKRKDTNRQLSVQIPSSNCATLANLTVVGFEIYVIGSYNEPSSTVRVLDCRSHTWRDAPSMNVARRNPRSCIYDGKIYVIGGISRLLEDESSGEVFDIKTQTWERLPEPGFEIHKGFCCGIAELEGKIYFRNGYADIMYAYYDPKKCKWDNNIATFPWPECMMDNAWYSECVMDNVRYSFRNHDGRYNLWWRDINGSDIKEVKGLVAFGNMYERFGGSIHPTIKAASSGGKLYVIWKEYMMKQRKPEKIWCAEISLEKRDGDEIWGNVEWLDVIHTSSTRFCFMHCLTISL